MKKLIVFILLLAAVGSYAQLPSYLPSNGLVGWWPFNGNANDASGNGNNGTVNGATLTTDRVGNANRAYSFNGINNFILVSDNASLRPDNITLSAWIKTTSNQGSIIGKTNFSTAQSEQYQLTLDYPNYGTAFAIKQNSSCNPGNGWQYSKVNVNTYDDNWHFIVGTFNGTALRLYIDGVLVNTNNTLPLTKIDNCIGGNLQIGRWWDNFPYYFNGKIDDIAIYNRALTPQEVSAIYAGEPNGNCLAAIVQNDTTICAGTSVALSVKPVSNLQIGQEYGGGKVAYVLQPGDNAFVEGQISALIASVSDMTGAANGVPWSPTSPNAATGATGSTIGTGEANTNLILSIQGGSNYAAKLCADYVAGQSNEYADWYLPSIAELRKIYENLGGVYPMSYWSSTELDVCCAATLQMGVGTQGSLNKTGPQLVRAMRTSRSSYTYLWSNGATTPTINVSPTTSTTYYVTVSNGISSCIDSVKVNVTQINRNFFPQDTIKVCGTSYTLDAGAGNTYSWSTGATTRTINVTATGKYKCTVTTNNCSASDSVFVSLVNANIVNNDTTICSGNSVNLSIGKRFVGKSICSRTELPASLQNGLLAFYPFCGNANDQSGNNNNGTVNGATLTSNRFSEINNSYFFNGSNNYIDLPAVFNSPSFTLSVWGNSDVASSFCSPCHVLFSKISNPNVNNNFELRGPNEFIYGDGTGNGSNFNLLLFDGNNLSLGDWYHIVVRYDAVTKQASIYLNGILRNTSTGGALSNIINQAASIGARPGTRELPFYGKIDDVFFYNRIITDSEVVQLYNLGSTISWSTSESSPLISVLPNQSTTYYVTVSNGISSCTDSVKVNVTQFNRNFFPQDTIKACGTSYTLDAGAGNTYNWSTGATTRTINVNTTGRYRCTVTTNNCTASDSVFVSLVNANIVNNDTTVCSGVRVVLSATSFIPQFVSDIDGNKYPAINIGSQTWMQKNLNVSRYRNGDLIPQVTNSTQWASLRSGAWCWYNNDSATYALTYGKLYNWYAINDSRGLYPDGWKIPREYDWNKLIAFIDRNADTICTPNFNCAQSNIAGGALKDTATVSTTYWLEGINNFATNSTGFTGLPAGIRAFPSGNFEGVGIFSSWWSADKWTAYNDPERAWTRYVNRGGAETGRIIYNLSSGLSIRCLKVDTIIFLPISYRWSTGDTTATINVSPSQSTTYYVTVSNGISTCADSVRINVNQINSNFFAQDTIKACGSSYTLDAGSGNSYRWNNGSNNRTISITSTGKYFCTVTTNNCTATDSVFVSLVNANIVNADTTVCLGTSVLLRLDSTFSTSLRDIDNNIYPAVTIGNQVWTRKNLTVSRYRNGDIVPQVTDPLQWINLTTGAWCWYNNDSASYAAKYGKLYNWYAVTDSRGLAPNGWHVPVNSEWNVLAKFLDPLSDTLCNNCIQSPLVGGFIKDSGIVNWTSPNYGATNSSGFTALPSGYRGGSFPTGGSYVNLRNEAYWWSANDGNSNNIGNYRLISSNGGDFIKYNNSQLRSTGFAVRVLQDRINYLWSNGATTNSINVAPIQSDNYYLIATNGISTCKDSVRVIVTQINRNFFPQDTIKICGASTTLDAGTGNSYSWNTGATTRAISVTNSGRYRCTVTTNNCTATDSVFVSIVRANIINNDTTINAGSSLTLIADSSSFGTPRPALLWSTGSTATRTSVTPQTNTTYSLRVTNGSSSCTDSVRVNINPLNLFTIRAATRTGCGPAEITSANTVVVPVTVDRFTRMVSLQGSINWDSTVLRYQGISSFAPGIGLVAGNFNNTAANNLTFSWVDATLAGQTLADSSTLFTIRFNLAGNARGRSTSISFDNQPTLLEAVQSPATLLSVVPRAGSVRITARPFFDTTRLSGCGSVSYNGTTYTNSTSVNTTISGPTGCDSIYRTAIITVNPLPVVNPITTNSPLLIGETLRFNVTGQNLEGGTYNWTGPNSFFSTLQNPTLTAAANTSGQYRMIYTSTCRRDTQTVSVTVNAGISGRIVSPLSQPISRVNLLRNNVPTLVSGSYNIAVNPASPLVLKAAKNNDVSKINGVSVLDVVLIQNHILRRILLNSPYKIIAGDVNRSGTLTSFDLVYIQRLILGLDTTFPGNSLWAFADSSYTFPNPANPFPYKDSFSYTSANLQSNRSNQTFIGMKLGDVNYDWNYLQLRPVPSEDVTLYHDDVQPEGNTIRIPIKVKNLKDLLGMQFTLKYNSAVLRFSAIENNRLNLKYGNTRSGQGLLSFIWSDERNLPASLSDDAVLMEMVFEKTGEFSKEAIQLVNTIATVEAWDKNYRKHNIIKGRGRILNNIKPGTPGWTVSPNPTTGQVVVNLTLQKAQRVELLLTTADGRVLKTWKQNFAAGTSAWPLDLKSGGYLPAGMYWMKIPEVDGVVRKIVVE
jgi:uncharacterized protein (TIGR02145 family)